MFNLAMFAMPVPTEDPGTDWHAFAMALVNIATMFI